MSAATRNHVVLQRELASIIARGAAHRGVEMTAADAQSIAQRITPLVYRLPYGKREPAGYDVVDKARLTLTPCQRQALVGVARGLTSAEIGAQLFLSYDTVKSRLHAAYVALGARNASHAVAICLKYRLLTADEIADV